ncbi:P-loop containing nucleoside triphosphate hydrolase protein [Ceratobasidium sp. AG-I]|nr:P-loop containing nucleoside triphosphate hydrolase protein [Ceratobasidium sp. AG-I]
MSPPPLSEKSSSDWDGSNSETPLMNDKASTNEKTPESNKNTRQFREIQLGIWTLYFPLTGSWRDYLPALDSLWMIYDLTRSIPIVWKFVLETLALGPGFFAMYFISSTLTSILPAVQLFNNSKILALVEDVSNGNATNRKQFEHVVVTYLTALAIGFVLRKLVSYSQPILQQRVSLHFKQRLLTVQARFDLTTAENPDVQSKTSRASGYFASAWTILEGLVEFISIAAEVSGQASVLAQVVKSHQHAKMFGLICLARPLATQLWHSGGSDSYYAMITDNRWLRMDALYSLGTSTTYKKEVIGDNLQGYINTQYDKDRKDLGDTPEQDPHEQRSNRSFITYGDFDAIFDSLPLLVFAWNSLNAVGDRGNLSSLVLMQQAAGSLQSTFWRIMYSSTSMASLFKNAMALYEVLELKPAMVDGDVMYPEEEFKDRKGVAIEFKSVDFRYPMTDKLVLKDMSFAIDSGQLCVIVGENGCGKSTTINLITRMYDCTAGEVLVDGRPLRDFVMSSFRDTASVMYQDYNHLPLTISENILLGRPDCKNPTEAVEEAARLGGAYDFIQKLPLKFETNLEPGHHGFSSNSYGEESDEDTYQQFIDAQKAPKLSGGEWQRLALSKTFMKNSDKVRLLCYDEPSASLDPKAEYEMFERLRNLRGEKTMIFVTHRFGHLTKHADLILYVKEGAIVEKGTHKELLALDGEYAKMYKIQSQAFVD